MTVRDNILKALTFYHKHLMRKVLKTKEEVEANTTEDNLVAAPVVSELINNLNGCSFEQEGTDFYITGADSVRKKLGSGEPLHLTGYIGISGSCSSGGYSRRINVSTTGTLLELTLPHYNILTVNYSAGCSVTFKEHILKILANQSSNNSQSDVADGGVSTSHNVSYDITLS